MATQSPSRPILSHGRRNPKYGRYDFERFDHLSSSLANVGYSTFHKVNVDCRFLFKKSRWGVLGEKKNPAGIIYLDLTFDQPKDCQLHSATVIVTLDDQADELRALGGTDSASSFDCPVHLTDCYGPKGFTGPEKTVHSKKSMHFTPNANFAGFGIGGLGANKESSMTSSSRWKFSGHLQGHDSKGWTYKSLKWHLSENDLESESTHSSEVHTAFTFAHGGQPFFMRVEIQGKLKKLHARVKDKLMKFPSSAKKDDGSIVTLINFGNRMDFEMPLDKHAEELADEMEMANLYTAPMEPKTTAPFQSWAQLQNSVFGSSSPQELPASIKAQKLQRAGDFVTTTGETTDPMLATLAQAFVDVCKIDGKKSYDNDSTTFPPAALSMEDATAFGANSQILSSTKKDKISEEQMIVKILQMPGFLIFLRVIAGLVGLFDRIPFLTIVNQKVDQKPGNVANETKFEGEIMPK